MRPGNAQRARCCIGKTPRPAESTPRNSAGRRWCRARRSLISDATSAAHRSINGVTRMRVGVPKEIKSDEYRVALMPVGAETLTKAGHEVLVEEHAGTSSGFPDDAYVKAGARIVPTAKEI